MKNKQQHEEAVIMPNIQGIIERDEKFQMIKCIMEILCKELGISIESKPREIFDAINKVSTDYYKAIDEFRELRNQNQGRGNTTP